MRKYINLQRNNLNRRVNILKKGLWVEKISRETILTPIIPHAVKKNISKIRSNPLGGKKVTAISVLRQYPCLASNTSKKKANIQPRICR